MQAIGQTPAQWARRSLRNHCVSEHVALRRQRYVDFCWAARDIAVLWLRALLSQSRGEEAAYQDLAQRYRSDGDITWL